MWVRMDSTHTTNNPRIEMITAVDDAGGDVQYIIDGNSGSGNFGKVGLELNPAGAASSTIWSVGSTYWTAMSDSRWHPHCFGEGRTHFGFICLLLLL